MRSFIGTRVKAICNGEEKIGMVSSIQGDKILITISQTEFLTAPLDDAEISKANDEDLAQGIEFTVEW